MKKIICFLLVIVMMFSLVSTVYANDEDHRGISNDEIEVYMARISKDALHNNYDVNNQIDFNKLHIDVKSGKNCPDEVLVTTLDYSTVMESNDPFFQRVKNMLDETRAKGFKVHSVIIVLPYTQDLSASDAADIAQITRGDPSDPNYWIQNTTYWGTYQNQDIRYYFTSFSVSKPKANVGNRPSTWANILSAVAKIAVDRFCEAIFYDTVYKVITDIQSVLGAATPVNYTFDSATEWVKSESVGTLTYKEVVLEDINNKISGYAYYPWGSLQQLQFQTRIEVKYYAGLQNGSPYYPVVTSPYSNTKYVSSRYYSNKTALFPILRQYYNYVGYSLYSESVDIDSALF